MMEVSDGAPHWQRSHLMNDIPALQNRDLPRTADLIEDALGDTCPIWERFLEALEDPELHLAVSWRWYVDGGWLGKVMRGTRNFACSRSGSESGASPPTSRRRIGPCLSAWTSARRCAPARFSGDP